MSGTSKNRLTNAQPIRDVVIGKHAKVWLRLSRQYETEFKHWQAFSHTEVAQQTWTAADRVWVFSYSPAEAENRALLDGLREAGEVVYIGSSSSIVCTHTACYHYPHVKQCAQDWAKTQLQARVLTLGLVVADPSELPAGASVATSLAQLAAFMSAPAWPTVSDQPTHLFDKVTRPFSSKAEHTAHRVYTLLARGCGRWPCLLRPLDLAFKAMGWRWTGYTHMSNRLWMQTTL